MRSSGCASHLLAKTVGEGLPRILMDYAGPDGALALWWLGQAGFAVHAGERTLLIDPYLSNHLAQKYRGREFAHERMMPPPVAGEELCQVDAVLCTHRHGDHMDPGLLPSLARRQPNCRFVLPRADREAALEMGLPEDRLILMNDSERVDLPGQPMITIEALASAHEELKVNDHGEHHYLGYVIRCGALSVYHSGDCIPYPGLGERLAECGIDLALLPVNGRSVSLTSRGILGNFSLDEALALKAQAGIPWMIAHHFGMFAFNTADPDQLRAQIAQRGLGDCVHLADTTTIWMLKPSSNSTSQETKT